MQFRLDPVADLPPGEWRARLELASGAVKHESMQSVSLGDGEEVASSEPEPSQAADPNLLSSAVVTVLALTFASLWATARRRS